MTVSRAARRRAIAYFALLLASLLIFTVGTSAPMQDLRRGFAFAMTPIQAALSGATRNVTSFVGAFADVERLRLEVQQLQASNDLLRSEQQQNQALRSQNEQLSTLLQVRSQVDFTTVTATVVGRGVAPNESVATLDVGASQGIETGDPVIGPGQALVGRIIDVGQDYSHLLLLDDPRMSVVGMTTQSRATGIVQGQLAGTLAMTQIASTDTVSTNDQIVTAGLSLGDCIRSPYPKGLVIGRVVDVTKNPDAIVQSAVVQPAVALDQLEYVLVITDYQGGLIDGGSGCATPGPTVAPGASAKPSGSPSGSSKPSATPTETPGIVLPSPSLGGSAP